MYTFCINQPQFAISVVLNLGKLTSSSQQQSEPLTSEELPNFDHRVKLHTDLQTGWGLKIIRDEQSVHDCKGEAIIVIFYMMEKFVFDFKQLGLAISFSLRLIRPLL